MAGTAWNVFAPNTKIKSSAYNDNFDWLEGNLVPMSGGSMTDGAYDIGTASNKWNTVYSNNLVAINGLNLGTASTSAPQRIISDTNSMDFYVNDKLAYQIESNKHIFTIQSSTSYQTVAQFDLSGAAFYAGGAVIFKIDTSGTYVTATKKLYLDGGGNTYIQEQAADTVYFYVGGTAGLIIDTSKISLNNEINSDIKMDVTKKLYFDGGGDTYIYESTANNMTFYANATQSFNIGPSSLDCSKTLKPNGTNIDLGTSGEYWKNFHYASATSHSLKNPIETNVVKKLRAITDMADKAQYPQEIHVPAKNEGDVAGIAINKLLAYLIKSIQELDARLDALEK